MCGKDAVGYNNPMKPYIVTLTLGGLLLLGLLYLYVLEFPEAQRKAEEEKRAKQLISFQSDDVRSITLQYRDQEAINIERDQGGYWWLMQPLYYRADQPEVEDIIRDLAVANVTRVIHETSGNLGDYGLSPPQLTLSFTLQDRDEQFLIGEKGPVSSWLYFKRTSETQIYLTNLPDRDILSKTPYVLRRKELFDIARENIDRLRLEYHTGTFSLFKTGGVWFLDAPIEFLADQSVIGALLFQIENLKAGKFIDDSEEQKKIRVQLGLPELVMYVQANDIPYAVKFFGSSNDSEWVYATTTPDLPVFLVSRMTFQRIPNTLFKLRDKHLVVVDRSLVTDLAITTPDQQRTLPLEPTEQPMPHPVREFMNRVLNIQAEIFIQEGIEKDDLHTLGLARPELEVKLLGKDQHVLGSLIVSDILSTEDDGQVGTANASGSTLPGAHGIRSSILVNVPNARQ